MNPERWQKIAEILYEALEHEQNHCSTFLDQVCSDDPDLRAEVESLIEVRKRMGDFLELRGHVQSNVLADEIAIGRPLAVSDLLLSPSVEAIPDAGFLTNLRRGRLGPLDDEVFRCAVAGVVLDSQVQAETPLKILHAFLA